MKKRSSIWIGAWLLILLGLVACEMRDELKGRTNKGDLDQLGAFMLDLTSKEDLTKVLTKTVVNEYVVQILDLQGEIVKEFPSYATLKGEEKVIKLPVGTYRVRSASYAGGIEEATLDKPYYLGEKEFTLIPNEVAMVKDTCALNNVLVKVNFSNDFLNAVDENYAITLTNGTGVLTLNEKVKGTAYFKTAPSMTIAVRATTKNGVEIYKSQLLTGADNTPLKPEDIFEIELGIKDTIPSVNPNPDDPNGPDIPDTPDIPDNPSWKGIDITIDVTMNGKDVNIVIPGPDVDPDPIPNPNPTPNPDPSPSYQKPTIVGEGFDIDQVLIDPASVKVNIMAEAGVKNLYVTIDSEALTDEMLAVVGLSKSFDLANPGDKEQSLKELGLIGSTPVKRATQVPFDVSAFMALLAQLGEPGPHNFHLRVVDMQGNELSKTLSIKFNL